MFFKQLYDNDFLMMFCAYPCYHYECLFWFSCMIWIVLDEGTDKTYASITSPAVIPEASIWFCEQLNLHQVELLGPTRLTPVQTTGILPTQPSVSTSFLPSFLPSDASPHTLITGGTGRQVIQGTVIPCPELWPLAYQECMTMGSIPKQSKHLSYDIHYSDDIVHCQSEYQTSFDKIIISTTCRPSCRQINEQICEMTHMWMYIIDIKVYC